MSDRDLRPLDAAPMSVWAPFDVDRTCSYDVSDQADDRHTASVVALGALVGELDGVELGDYDLVLLKRLATYGVPTVGGLVSLLQRVRGAAEHDGQNGSAR